MPTSCRQPSAVSRDARLVEGVLAAGVEPNGIRSFPLLHRAVSKGFIEIVQLLVAAGADVERPNRCGCELSALDD